MVDEAIPLLGISQVPKMMIEAARLTAYPLGMSDLPYSAPAVGRRIIALREAFGLRQSEFADQLGLRRTEVNAWEMGERRPSLAKAQIILRTYPVTADWLFYGDSGKMSVEMAQRLLWQEPARQSGHPG